MLERLCAVVGVILIGLALVVDTKAPAPPVDTPRVRCEPRWPDRLVCFDVRTGRQVSECRKDALTGGWVCQ